MTTTNTHQKYRRSKMAIYVPPICKVPNCKQDSQILSKVGDRVRYMHTCSKHWNDLIPLEIKNLTKGNKDVRRN
jgi:hypothetical protein